MPRLFTVSPRSWILALGLALSSSPSLVIAQASLPAAPRESVAPSQGQEAAPASRPSALPSLKPALFNQGFPKPATTHPASSSPTGPQSAPSHPFVAGRAWFGPNHSGQPYVNPDLTPERLLGKSLKPDWEGQTVLWQGRVVSQESNQPQETGGQRTPLQGEFKNSTPQPEPTAEPPGMRKREVLLRLVTPAGFALVRFRSHALTLESDRTGYTVAIKGTPLTFGGVVTGLEGRSLLVLAPPAYRTWRPTWVQPKEAVTDFLTWWAGFQNPHLTPSQRQQIAQAIVRESRAREVDPLLLASLIQIESAYHIDARSRSGALGLGQLMPFTARWLGVNAYDISDNIKGAARLLSILLTSYRHERTRDPRSLALAGYNAGPGQVAHAHGVPAIPETSNYVYLIGYVHRSMSAQAARFKVPGVVANVR